MVYTSGDPKHDVAFLTCPYHSSPATQPISFCQIDPTMTHTISMVLLTPIGPAVQILDVLSLVSASALLVVRFCLQIEITTNCCAIVHGS